MSELKEIKKLPQELINQIAAGEVIERPASVVKELLDNAIDAGADQIKIRIKNGGLTLIEVSDNGYGIPREQLPTAFEAHSTSKVRELEDLNNLLTMGFRGEALSTIVSVSEVNALSKSEDSDEGYEIIFQGVNPGEIKPAARDQGTTVSVKNLFAGIPARQKYLKSHSTEYRKILEVLTPYFLTHPEIHFVLEKDSKSVYNLPRVGNSEANTIHETRIKEVLRSEFTNELIPLFYEGNGMVVTGYSAHPKYHSKKSHNAYMFVNNRPIYDKGIFRAVHEAYSRFIPHNEKVPFILSIRIKPDLVDVNVHPRKEEVRFLNAYRVYEAVEKAVSSSLRRELKDENLFEGEVDSTMANEDIAFSRLRERKDENNRLFDSSGVEYHRDNAGSVKEVKFNRQREFSVQQGLQFSQGLLEVSDTNEPDTEAEQVASSGPNRTFQIFNKYIMLEFEDELLIVDQHAAAERVTFERLKSYHKNGEPQVQNLLVPQMVKLGAEEQSYIEENKEFFSSIGLDLEIVDEGVLVNSVPAEFTNSELEKVFRDIFELSEDERDLKRSSSEESENVLATMACHTSIRSNQKLSPEEGISLYNQLMECENPYSCPHGRPIIWRQTLTEIDKHFYRTY